MAVTKVSSKFQVVIPKAVRERHNLEPGQSLQVLSKGDLIALIPTKRVSSYEGILRGVNSEGFREKTERFDPD